MVLRQQCWQFAARLSVLLFSVVFFSGPIAAETNVPNEFSSGSPAKAEEVNQNFAGLAAAIDDHWTRYPHRYYPDWRYDPTFYLELPEMSGRWAGRLLNGRLFGATSSRNFNFINRYDSVNEGDIKRIWLGLSIVPSHDASASQASKKLAGMEVTDVNLYSFSMSHHKDGSFKGQTYTQDPSMDSVYGDCCSWQTYMARAMVEDMLPKIFKLFKMESSEVAVSCETIQFHLNADYSVTVTGLNCLDTPYS